MKLQLRKPTSLNPLQTTELKPRKSTAILMAAWVGTFALWLFVKPDEPSQPGAGFFVNSVSTSQKAEPAAR
ncbi:hypothetical protein [Nocardia goodfellowii]|uniref:Uncharacterized protein n=1 Tax=Nocardia goodfellowii TaxID=882446 RepID=A0ABS4QEQ1_9NOCA|nr:hypothetical protein [Nocardia goodfellowii]MBP2189564.1 hypothetical protein [Nocardia goodfellowii]